MKFLFCLNLVFSYPLSIVPVFNTLESCLLGKQEKEREESETISHGSDGPEESSATETTFQYWASNMTRSGVVLLTVIIVVLIYEKLTLFIAVAGSIFGMTNVLLLPAIAHLKLIAVTKLQRLFDYFIIVFACIMMTFLPFTIIYNAD